MVFLCLIFILLDRIEKIANHQNEIVRKVYDQNNRICKSKGRGG